MNREAWDASYRSRDRMPHGGWAAFGPYQDRRANIASLTIRLCAVALAIAYLLFGG